MNLKLEIYNEVLLNEMKGGGKKKKKSFHLFNSIRWFCYMINTADLANPKVEGEGKQYSPEAIGPDEIAVQLPRLLLCWRMQ